MAVVSIVRVRQKRVAGGYDLGHLQAFHRAIFGALYPWAGQLRTLDTGEGGAWFHPHHRLKAAGAWAFGELAADGQLRGLDRDGFVNTRFRFVPRPPNPDDAVLAGGGVRTAGAAGRPAGVGALDQVSR